MKNLLIALLSLSLLAPLQSRADEPADAQAQHIKTLIAQLGDNDYNKRVAATDELKRIGKAALPALEEAAKSGDEEIRIRAKSIIKILNAPAPAAAPAANPMGALGGNGDMSAMLAKMLGGAGGQGGQGGNAGAMLGQLLGGAGGQGAQGGQGLDINALLGQMLGGAGGQGGHGGQGNAGAMLGQLLGGAGAQGGQGGNAGAMLGQLLGGAGGQGAQGGQGLDINALLGQVLGGAGGAGGMLGGLGGQPKLPPPTSIDENGKTFRISHKIVVEITETKDGQPVKRTVEAEDETDLEKKDAEAFKVYKKAMQPAPRAGGQPQMLQQLGGLQAALGQHPAATATAQVRTPTLDLIDSFGARFQSDSDGITVMGLKADSLADKSGLKVGDLVKKANGVALAKLDDLRAALEKATNKTPVELELSRDNKSVTVKVTASSAK